MNNIFGNFFYICKEIWGNIGISQKVSIILLAFVAFATLVGVGVWGTKTDWYPMYTNEKMELVSGAYDLALGSGIKVQMYNHGKGLMVEQKRRDELRSLVLKSDSLKSYQSGNENLQRPSKIMSRDEWKQYVNRIYKVRLENEIKKYKGVKDCKVGLNIPTRGVLAGKSGNTGSAAVSIEFYGGMVDKVKMARAISEFVAFSIPQIQPENVSVVERDGTVLKSANNSETNSSMNNSKYALKKKIENDIKLQIQLLLDRALGEDNYAVSLGSVMDFTEIVEDLKVPIAGGPMDMNIKTETTRKTKALAGSSGIAGTSRTIAVSGGGPADKSDSSNAESETKSSVDTKKIIMFNSIKRSRVLPDMLSVNVAIAYNPEALKVVGEKKDGEEEASVTTLNEADLKALIENIATSGFVAHSGLMIGDKSGKTTIKPRNIDVKVSMFANYKPSRNMLAEFSKDNGMMSIWDRLSDFPVARPIFGLFMLVILYKIFGSTFKGGQVERVELGRGNSPASYNEVVDDDMSDQLPEINQPAPLEDVSTRVQADPGYVATTLEAWLATGDK